jgi:hypothetical protein
VIVTGTGRAAMTFVATIPEINVYQAAPRRSCHGGFCLATESGVDCWIGVAQETERRLVRLAGRLSVEQVPELLRVCSNALSLQIDLSDLVSADAPGIEALQRLRSQGAILLNAPGYLQMKLDSRIEPAVILDKPSKPAR